ncbi:MAG: hypothetical protein JWN64_344 [Parcubacteria group bacterium]|nr:hypothetical protein [Parcubacteria group bacterium]
MERTVIFYHGNCPDGFGGAYSAWKKFGDSAEYIPLKRGVPEPEDFKGATVFFIDFTYPQEIMDRFLAEAGGLIVLDHHEGIQDVVESMPEHVYDVSRSGATIAWTYFHPDTEVPTLLNHIEDDDLFRFALPDTKPLMAYIGVHPFTFESWDELAAILDDPGRKGIFLEKARAYREYFDLLIAQAVERSKLVSFEGHEVYIGQTQPMKPMVSALGNALARKQPPFGMILQPRENGMSVSLRGDGSIDLTQIAKKYGGNGHPSSAAFFLPWGTPIPWEAVEEKTDEDTRD